MSGSTLQKVYRIYEKEGSSYPDFMLDDFRLLL